MTVRLLALDLDGTVIGDDLLISDRVLRAIAAAQEAGVIVTIATGRVFRSARDIGARLGIVQPLICYQGAMVAHAATGEMLYHKTLPLNEALSIIEETNRRGLHLNLYLNDQVFLDHVTPEALFYSRINMDLPLNEVGNLAKWLAGQGGAEPTKLVIITDPSQTDDVLAVFTEMYGQRVQVTKSHPRFTEFTNRECSKGHALAYLAGHYNVSRDMVMAIGDGHNDLDMIAWAGYGVAMSTSPPQVLEAARIVTGSLGEEGAAEAIERYVLRSSDSD